MAINFPSSPSDRDVHRENGITFFYDSGNTVWQKVTAGEAITIAFGVDYNGSAIITGTQGTLEVPYDFDIIYWTLLADQAGSCNVDMWSRDYNATAAPSPANSVTGNIGMTISAATANQSNDIGNWRMKKINAGNVITYNVQSCSTITRLSINLFGQKG